MPKKDALPFLREDLKLLEILNQDGKWFIYDPLQNRYFALSKEAYDILQLWENGLEVEKFILILQEHNYKISEEKILIFIDFLRNNSLIQTLSLEDIQTHFKKSGKQKNGFFKNLLKSYLFFRIPLFKSDRWLSKNLKNIEFLYTKAYRNFIIFLGVIGVLLTLINYDEFINTFMYLFSFEALIFYFISLVFVKSMHELGHAFTAKRLGLKVPHMGVAFLVMFPVLYTDTGDTWRLQSKYDRLKVVLAGVKVELYLAAIAIFLWSFLDDGIFRTVCFIIATTSLISSILINISPFLRFDGYYALSDITDTKNLQPRSFSMARWFLRKYILGADENQPEEVSKKRANFFIIYAILT
ncbi:MAG: site-2 protease family protein, partial [Campylobacterota bacterium]